MSKVTIYSRNNQIVFSASGMKKYYGVDGEVQASNDGNKITVRDVVSNNIILNKIDYRNIYNLSDNQFASTALATKTALNDLFDETNPADFASKTTLDILARGLKKVPDGSNEKFIVSVDNTATSGKLQVIDREARMNVGDTELKVEDTRSTLSVKSNYANLGSEQKSDAIVVSGNESTVGSTVEIKGKLKLARASESVWSMTNADANENVSFSGSSDWLAFPSLSSSNTANKLIRGLVTVGDYEDTVRGGRNYFTVSGLSSGDTVTVEVGVYVSSSAANTITLDDNRSASSDSSASSVAGVTNHTVTMTNTVDDFSDIQYRLDLETTGSGSYRVTSIDVTIS